MMKKPEAGQVWVAHSEALPENAFPAPVRRVLAYDKDLMCVENSFEKGTVVPVHSHPHSQITYIKSGEFNAMVGGEERVMREGDSIYVAGNVVHALTCTTDTGIAIDVFTPLREDFV